MELLAQEQQVTLSELLDQDSLQRLGMTFARMFGTGLAVLDAAGQLLVDVPAELAFCRQIRSIPCKEDVCGSFDMLAHSSDIAEGKGNEEQYCRCGLRYESVPLRHQNEILGRIIYGPYKPDNVVEIAPDLIELIKANGSDERRMQAYARATEKFRQMSTRSPEQVRSHVDALQAVLSVVIQAGYARHLTAQIHIEAIQDAYEELQEKNRRLADSVERLKELDKIRSSFLATFSHELRTPLTSIIGYSEMLLEGLAGELVDGQKNYLNTIMDKSNQLLRMINEILDISKIQSSTVQLDYQDVNLGQLLEQVVDSMMPQAHRKQVKLSFDIAVDMPGFKADKTRMKQVLLNLVSNGIKFTRDGGAVTITAKRGTLEREDKGTVVTAVELEITDEGIGIPEESWNLIFEAFYQVDSTSTRRYDGTGLGLAIVRQFVTAHGGRVWVKNSTTTGTTFALLIPAKPFNDLPADKTRATANS